jgi:hypothetical protein
VFFYPFKFWFCENWQSALPLIALQYHDVEMRIYWADNSAVTNTMEAWARYIYLDADERRMMAEKPMDLLIHQVQRIPASSSKTTDLTFNHPVKFIASTGSNFNASPTTFFSSSMVWTLVRRSQRRLITTRCLRITTLSLACKQQWRTVAKWFRKCQLLMIPFCLDASKLQPTGTCNFSRMDSATLRLPDSTIDECDLRGQLQHPQGSERDGRVALRELNI